MTEKEWLASSEPFDLFDYICRKSSKRKVRLFAVACCCRVLHAYTVERSRRAVELSELFADEAIPYSQLKELYSDSPAAPPEEDSAWWCTRLGKVQGPRMAAGCAGDEAVTYALSQNSLLETLDAFDAEQAAQMALFRDIFGNPFRPVSFDPHWRTSDVVDVARGIYEDKAFERMPILADALMDAGCEDEQIIGHCRGDGPHVRGCWVVDLVLGKE